MRQTFAKSIGLASLVALAACGGQQTPGDEAPQAPSPATTTAAAPATEAAAEPSAEVTQAALADLTGDAAAGAKVFVKCKACHVLEQGVNRVGPHLYGVVGRAAGSVDGFNYSTANSEIGITWSEETLFEYLEAPQDYIKGTRMAFAGIKDAQERADLIAYLAANGEV